MKISTDDYPNRHAKLATAARRIQRYSPLVKGKLVLDESQWNRHGRGLCESDPLADSLVDWIRAQENGFGWTVVRKAIASGFGTVDDSVKEITPVSEFFQTVEADPAWLDRDKLAVGQRHISRSHPAGYYILRNAGLMAGYLSFDLNKPLLLTGALSGGASRRIAQTMKWYSDCAALGGLDRHAGGYQSTLNVRLLHAVVRRHIAASESWDYADMGLPINQTDMAATWLAFSVVYLAGVRLMGVPVSSYESECVMHLLSYACWLMGLDETWLTDDEQKGRKLLFQILSTYRKADESSKQLGRALMGEIPEIPYPGFKPIRWRMEQLKHLSTTRMFVGRRGMKQLGLPTWVPPVYPLACIPLNALKLRLVSKIPGQRSRQERKGTIAREELVRIHFAGAEPHLAERS